MKILADKTGFEIFKIEYDSKPFQFWGSEQYKNGISLLAYNSYFVNPKKSIFSSRDIRGFIKKTAELNKKNNGDQAIFYIRRKI